MNAQKKWSEIATEIPDQPLKISVVGLTNGGKTSLLKTLFHKFEEVENLSATRQIERSISEFLHHPLIMWDFGGQDRYCAQYLKKPELYFKRIAQLFYVIDCQDQEKLAKNLQYFEQIVQVLHQYSPDSNITLLYNKYDPEHSNLEKLDDFIQIFKDKAIPILTKHGFGYQAYKTSILVPLWIMTAFSKSMLDNPKIYDEISRSLQHFATSHDLDAAIVFTKEGFGLGYYFSDDVKVVDIRDIFIKFFTKFEQMYNLMPVIDLNFADLNIYSTRIFLKPQTEEFPLFFGVIYKNKSPISQEIDEFIYGLRVKLEEIYEF